MKGTLTGRCRSCGEHHNADGICPPHEVRTTGVQWFKVYIAELEAEVERRIADQPKCECGCTVGLDFYDGRWWCFNCVRAEVGRLQVELGRYRTSLDDAAERLAYREVKIKQLQTEVGRLQREKDARIYYQEIVYAVCNSIDKIKGRPAYLVRGIACGTLETPTTEVQDAMLVLEAEFGRLQDLENAVQRYVTLRTRPVDWATSEAEWKKVVAQATQLAADAAKGDK